jgi:hypothetical protein
MNALYDIVKKEVCENHGPQVAVAIGETFYMHLCRENTLKIFSRTTGPEKLKFPKQVC